MASACIMVERGVVGFGLDYACAHIIIPAGISSLNLLPIQANFVTGRVKLPLNLAVSPIRKVCHKQSM